MQDFFLLNISDYIEQTPHVFLFCIWSFKVSGLVVWLLDRMNLGNMRYLLKFIPSKSQTTHRCLDGSKPEQEDAKCMLYLIKHTHTHIHTHTFIYIHIYGPIYIYIYIYIYMYIYILAQRCQTPSYECLGYHSKQSDCGTSVIQELWGMRSIPSLPSFRVLLCPGVVAPDRVPCMGQIKLNCVLMLNWIFWNVTVYIYKKTYSGWYAIKTNQTKPNQT